MADSTASIKTCFSPLAWISSHHARASFLTSASLPPMGR